MNLNPKVSVIIPTYKRNHYLKRSIDSVLSQSYSNIEIIVIDDNNPMDEYRRKTEEMMLNYSNRNNIIYKKNQSNIGGSLSRNAGILIASGEYITFLDDDDTYKKDKIKNQVNFMKKNNYDMTFTNLIYLNHKGQVIEFRNFKDIKSYDSEYLFKYHLMKHITGTPTYMFNTKKLKKMGGFTNVKMGQEFYLMIKAIKSNLNIMYFNDSNVVAYRNVVNSISFSNNKIIGEKKLFLYKKKYFYLFNRKEKKYIRFRHYAVLAVAYKRNKKFIMSAIYLMLSFIKSPMIFLSEVNIFLRKKNLIKKLGEENE